MSGSAYPSTSRRRSRPDLYSGSRRRFSGVGTIASGFVALVLVLGALLTSELDHYTTHDDDPPQLPTAAAVPGIPSAAPGGTPAPTPTADVVNNAVLTTVNQQLDRLGCRPVTLDPTLVAAARSHMDTMVATGYLDLKTPDGTDPGDRAGKAGFPGRRVVESVVLGADSAQEAASYGFPAPGDADEALPITVQLVSRSTLMCGYTSLGADYRRDTRNVPIWSVILGTR
ncbi:CAP domain-containing protein [Cryptosporangium phraense]|uniref:CAP domain-containing protein n=1 Tax=Cryptosporangium phraense TaxID=2593070 RepID=UPI0014784529|nr:CAP domain-containing protein [Cryptosporangium phraense]